MKVKLLICNALLLWAIGASAQNGIPREDTSLVAKQYQATISRQGRMAGMEAYEMLAAKYKIPHDQTSQVLMLLVNREKEKVARNYIYPRNLRRRVAEKQKIDSIYRDKLFEILIPYNEIAGEYMGLALLAADLLHYTDKQHAVLKGKAMDIARRLYANPRLNTGDEEMNILRNTLNEEQLDTLLDCKNAGVATRQMNQGWARLREAGLAEELDSVKDCTRAYLFYLKQHKIMDLHRGNATVRNRLLQDMNRHKPPLVRLLDGLDRSAKIKSEETKKIGRDFVW